MHDIKRDEIMDLYKNPHNKGSMNKPTISVSKKNPMCGDEVNLQLKIDNGIITDAKFDGNACSVSIISSSVLTDYIIGKSINEVKKIKKNDLLKLIDMNLSTSRISCASVVFSALQNALEDL
ncbi:MAG TPA: iron-sulfur cluster assembly scaffold protein [bacterium]|nr:iron-sulfur cluster assembly scaffold protein [bacterium]